MSFGWKDLVQFFKIPAKVHGAVVIVVGVYLLLPSESDVVQATQKYRLLAWLIGAFSGASLVVEALTWAAARWRVRQPIRNGKKYLNSGLSKAERELLRKFIHEGTKTLVLSYTDGTVKLLESNLVIYRASTISVSMHVTNGPMFPYNMQTWAWRYLRKNKALLEVSAQKGE